MIDHLPDGPPREMLALASNSEALLSFFEQIDVIPALPTQ
jgi:hypothetical protein